MRLISVCKKELFEFIIRFSVELGRIHTNLFGLHYEFKFSHILAFEYAKLWRLSQKTKYFTFLLSLWLNIHCAALLGESLNNSNSEYSNARVLFNSIGPSKIQQVMLRLFERTVLQLSGTVTRPTVRSEPVRCSRFDSADVNRGR